MSYPTSHPDVSEIREAQRSFMIFMGVTGSLDFFICGFDMGALL